MKNVVELCAPDVSQSPGVFAMELHCQFWSRDFGGRLPGIVFVAISFPLDEVLESSLVPTTVEYLFYFPLCFSVDDYYEGNQSGLQEIPQLNYSMKYVITHL